jgi:hypothetical protein
MIDLSKLKTAEQKAVEVAQATKDVRIAELKQLLRETDYVALSDYDKAKPKVVAQRQVWREEIRQLEAQ